MNFKLLNYNHNGSLRNLNYLVHDLFLIAYLYIYNIEITLFYSIKYNYFTFFPCYLIILVIMGLVSIYFSCFFVVSCKP